MILDTTLPFLFKENPVTRGTQTSFTEKTKVEEMKLEIARLKHQLKEEKARPLPPLFLSIFAVQQFTLISS